MAAPPARASGKASPDAKPSMAGAVKKCRATATAVANRSAPEMAVADGSAVAAGPPTAVRLSVGWEERYEAVADAWAFPAVKSTAPDALAAAAPADKASANAVPVPSSTIDGFP